MKKRKVKRTKTRTTEKKKMTAKPAVVVAAAPEKRPRGRQPVTFGANYVAGKLKIQPMLARLKLQAADIEKVGGVYNFKTKREADRMVKLLRGKKKAA